MKTLRAIVAAAIVAIPASARAHVVRVQINSRSLIGGGYAFGSAGAYERITGRVFIELDPRNPHDTAIVDLSRAPRDARGNVDASADFVMLRPVTPRAGGGVALVEVVNRGIGGATLSTFGRDARRNASPDSAAYYGDAMLLRMGVTVVFLGWQFDTPNIPGALKLYAPVATDRGFPITGLVRADWTVDEPSTTLPLGHRVANLEAPGYPVDDPNAPVNVLTMRDSEAAPRITVPRESWRFARDTGGRAIDDSTHIYMSGGFKAGKIYELVYEARNPVVVGTGLAMVRDFISYMKYDPASIAPVKFGMAYGVSQTGRFLRHFVYQGFNTDEAGRTAYDGLFVHTAGAGRGGFNHRFAQPSRDAQPYTTFFYPVDIFPFTSRTETDPVTGSQDGLLTHDADPAHLPKIFYVDGGYEYWGRAASLVHTTPDGTRDVEFFPNERRYVIASAKHSSPSSFPPSDAAKIPGTPAYRGDPLQLRFATRALFHALFDWVVSGTEPPASTYPTIARQTLVAPDSVRYPRIPGLPVARHPHDVYRLYFGPRWNQGIIDYEPPRLGAQYPVLVTQVDSLGNDDDGIRSIELLAPLATYFPWQLRTGMAGGSDRLFSFDGTFVPLPKTEAARRAAGDSRPSLERLYGTQDAYLAQARTAANRLVAERFLLPEDVDAAMELAAREWGWVMSH